MVPESLAEDPDGAEPGFPPHSKHAAPRAAELDAALIDNAPILVTPLDNRDGRAYPANVAGPTALLVAKLHKFGERQSTPGPLVDKDAHDLYRLLVATPYRKTSPTRCGSSKTILSLVRSPTKPSAVCDVGGATGELSIILVQRHPHLRCVRWVAQQAAPSPTSNQLLSETCRRC